ncbi:MAG: hypothetical protein AB7O84_11800 [Planctomycetota bacterium]
MPCRPPRSRALRVANVCGLVPLGLALALAVWGDWRTWDGAADLLLVWLPVAMLAVPVGLASLAVFCLRRRRTGEAAPFRMPAALTALCLLLTNVALYFTGMLSGMLVYGLTPVAVENAGDRPLESVRVRVRNSAAEVSAEFGSLAAGEVGERLLMVASDGALVLEFDRDGTKREHVVEEYVTHGPTLEAFRVTVGADGAVDVQRSDR